MPPKTLSLMGKAENAPPGSKADAASARGAKAGVGPGNALRQEVMATTAPPAASAVKQVARLQEQADQYTRKIELERRRVADLDRQIAEYTSKIMEQRRKVGGVNAGRENDRQIAIQMKILENRLDKAMVKYNTAVARNKELRQNINDLRRERLVFDDIYKRLECDLAEKKREMAQVLEVSNKAYEARDAALSEMQRLKLQAEREQAAFQAEWHELTRLIDHDRKVRDFNKNRRQEKAKIKDQVKAVLETESRLRKKVISGNWSIAKDKVHQMQSMEKVQSYGEAFAAIQEATGMTDIEELVTKFMHAEDENFRLYRYVDELNQEITRIDEQIVEIQQEIQKFKGGSVGETSRKKVLMQIEERLSATEAKADVYERKYQSALSIVNMLKDGVESIYQKLGCGTEGLVEGADGVTEANLMRFMGSIEQRTNEILQLYASSQALIAGMEVSPGAAVAVLGQGPHAAHGSSQFDVNPPTMVRDSSDEESEDEDDTPDNRPLSLLELKDKAAKNISKRREMKLRSRSRRPSNHKEGSGGGPSTADHAPRMSMMSQSSATSATAERPAEAEEEEATAEPTTAPVVEAAAAEPAAEEGAEPAAAEGGEESPAPAAEAAAEEETASN